MIARVMVENLRLGVKLVLREVREYLLRPLQMRREKRSLSWSV
jgi:hypothetical protein